MGFADRVALITGASSGIGWEMALGLKDSPVNGTSAPVFRLMSDS